MEDCLAVLPELIYSLESFDARLVRESLLNNFVARLSAPFVPAVFSGEGADELFAGYEYLKRIPVGILSPLLRELIKELHYTALQRVDRCAGAHGLIAHLSYLDAEVLDYALRIPARFKIMQGVDKWILRQAALGKLPDAICIQSQDRAWQSAGVDQFLADYAGRHISTADFDREKHLPNGWVVNSQEELMYYRIFRENFGECKSLAWMGRTKPTQ